MLTQDEINEIRWNAAKDIRELESKIDTLTRVSDRESVNKLIIALNHVTAACRTTSLSD